MAGHRQTIVYLVRHGETDQQYSRDQSTDAERQLTERGRRQVAVLGEFFIQFAPSAIYTSPLDRCRDSAVIIQQKAGSSSGIIPTNQLLEIYSSEPRDEAGERGESIFETILRDHRAEQVVAVTHQYIIGYIVADFLGVEYREVPCDFADVYRLVFADGMLVEATRLQPAHGV